MMGAALLGLTACSNDIEERSDAPTELRLTTEMEVAQDSGGASRVSRTRSVANPQTTQFSNNKLIDVFISENNPGTVISSYDQPLKARADGNGNLTFRNSGNTQNFPQYWPTSGNGVNIYAWYPDNVAGTDITATTKTFTVQTNQHGDITTSDLMFGEPKKDDKTTTANPVARTKMVTSQTVPLTFVHLLSKLKVVLTPGTGSISTDKLKKAQITIGDVKTGVTLNNLKTGQVTTRTGASDPKGTVTILDGTQDETTGYAIIPAQNLNGVTITVKLADSVDGTVYKLTLDNTYALDAGKMHTYTIKVNLTELKVSSTITDWAAGTNKTVETVQN